MSELMSLSDLENQVNQESSQVQPLPVQDDFLSKLEEKVDTTEVNQVQDSTNQHTPISNENILDKMVFDLSKIEIVKSDNPMKIFNDLNTIYNRPSYDIMATQSAYRASMRPLNGNDIYSMRRIGGTDYEQTLKVFKVVYDHIATTSIGKISFEDWLKTTSEGDLSTFVYGLFCASFPGDSDYHINCPHCKSKNTVKVNKQALVRKPAEETIKFINELLAQQLEPEEMLKKSLVNITNRILLPAKKIIVDITTPTLFDNLESIIKNKENPAIASEVYNLLRAVKTFYIPNLEAIKEGRTQYYELSDEASKLDIFNRLDVSDRNILETEVGKRLSKYQIDFSIPDIMCSNISCHKPIKNIEIDPIELLFLLIHNRGQE